MRRSELLWQGGSVVMAEVLTTGRGLRGAATGEWLGSRCELEADGDGAAIGLVAEGAGDAKGRGVALEGAVLHNAAALEAVAGERGHHFFAEAFAAVIRVSDDADVEDLAGRALHRAGGDELTFHEPAKDERRLERDPAVLPLRCAVGGQALQRGEIVGAEGTRARGKDRAEVLGIGVAQPGGPDDAVGVWTKHRLGTGDREDLVGPGPIRHLLHARHEDLGDRDHAAGAVTEEEGAVPAAQRVMPEDRDRRLGQRLHGASEPERPVSPNLPQGGRGRHDAVPRCCLTVSASLRFMPGMAAISSALAALMPRTEPKALISAFRRDGPTPGTESICELTAAFCLTFRW